MRKELYTFILLVSCSWGVCGKAKKEIINLLRILGDESSVVKRTIAEGIIGINTKLNSREVIHRLRNPFNENPLFFKFTMKWILMDLRMLSDISSLKDVVEKLSDMILSGERLRITVGKRRYTPYHEINVMKELADIIEEKVDLKNPEKILRLDIIGKCAGMSIITPREIFSIKTPSFNCGSISM